MLIVNADDFGLDQNVNRAIVRSFELGLCSSCTLMANMPGFEEACGLAHECRLLDHVGIHLVFKEGPPLTEAIKGLPRLCNGEGQLALSESSPFLTLEAAEARALAAEMRAQIARSRTNGLRLTHLDSHFHLHTRWAILGVVLAVAQSEHIRWVRLARNCGPGISFSKRLYKFLVNRKIQREGFARTKYFCGLDDYLALKGADRLRQGSLEVMVHPQLHGEGFVAEVGRHEPLGALMAACKLPREAISYSGVRYD